MDQQLDPKMLENLDLLLNYEVLESESDWDLLHQLPDVETDAVEKVTEEDAPLESELDRKEAP